MCLSVHPFITPLENLVKVDHLECGTVFTALRAFAASVVVVVVAICRHGQPCERSTRRVFPFRGCTDRQRWPRCRGTWQAKQLVDEH